MPVLVQMLLAEQLEGDAFFAKLQVDVGPTSNRRWVLALQPQSRPWRGALGLPVPGPTLSGASQEPASGERGPVEHLPVSMKQTVAAFCCLRGARHLMVETVVAAVDELS